MTLKLPNILIIGILLILNASDLISALQKSTVSRDEKCSNDVAKSEFNGGNLIAKGLIYSYDGDRPQYRIPCSIFHRFNPILKANNENVKSSLYEIEICKNSLPNRVKQINNKNSISDGILRVSSHGVLRFLVEVLRSWEINRKRIVILDENSGYYGEEVKTYFKRCNFVVQQVTTVTEKNINSDWFQILNNYRYIVFLTSPSTAKTILLNVNGSKIFEKFHNWMIVSEEMPQMFLSGELMNFINPQQSQLTLIIPQQHQTFYFESEDDGKRNDIVCDNNSTNPKIEIKLEKTMAEMHKMTTEVELYEIFYSHKTGNIETINFARWTYFNGLIPYNRLKDENSPLKGRIVRVASTATYPYVFLNKNRTRPDDGVLFYFYLGIERHLGAIHQMDIPSNHSYGIYQNGEYIGVLGSLEKAEDDIALAIAGNTPFRKEVTHHLFVCCRGYLQMALPRPDPQVPPTLYVMPFQLNVWLVIIAATVAMATAIIAVLFITPTNDEFEDATKKKILFWIVSGQFIDDALERAPGVAAKIISYTLLTSVSMVFIYYSSVLTAVFTYRETKLPFNTFDEMAVNNEYKVLLVGGGNQQHMFERATEGSFKKVWDKVVAEKKQGLMEQYHGTFQHMLTGKYVFVTDGPLTQYLAKGNCKTVFPNAKYNKEFYHTWSRKDFPYNHLYSRSMLKLWEGGIVNRWEKKLLRYNQKECDDPNVSYTLGLERVFTLFVFIVVAYTASVFALIIEIIYHRLSI